MDSDYEKRWNEYFIEGTEVFKNYLGITDYNELAQKETDITFERLVELYEKPIEGRFDKKHLCDIHKYLFGDLYPFAGKYRTVYMTKPGSYFVSEKKIDYHLELVLKEMQDEVLIQLAHELTETVRKNRTVDWDKKESARAFMRREIKRLLRKYHYPPTKADEAVQTVVLQAELMGENYDIKLSDENSIDAQHGMEYLENDFESLARVAEEGEKYAIKEDNN